MLKMSDLKNIYISRMTFIFEENILDGFLLRNPTHMTKFKQFLKKIQKTPIIIFHILTHLG